MQEEKSVNLRNFFLKSGIVILILGIFSVFFIHCPGIVIKDLQDICFAENIEDNGGLPEVAAGSSGQEEPSREDNPASDTGFEGERKSDRTPESGGRESLVPGDLAGNLPKAEKEVRSWLREYMGRDEFRETGEKNLTDFIYELAKDPARYDALKEQFKGMPQAIVAEMYREAMGLEPGARFEPLQSNAYELVEKAAIAGVSRERLKIMIENIAIDEKNPGSNAGFIDSIFEEVTGQKATAAALDYCLSALYTGKTRDEVAGLIRNNYAGLLSKNLNSTGPLEAGRDRTTGDLSELFGTAPSFENALSGSGPLSLRDYPRPPGDTGRGIHWIPTCSQSPEVVSRYVAEAKAMGISWVTFLNEGTNKGKNDFLVKELVSNNIMPVMRIYTARADDRLEPREVTELVKHYRPMGVYYYQLYNEPNHEAEWGVSDWKAVPPDAPERYAARWVEAARAVVEAGGLPGFGSMAPGHPNNDAEYFRRAMDYVISSGNRGLLERSWISVHNYTLGRALEDRAGFSSYQTLNEIVKEKLGRSLPVIGTEGGSRLQDLGGDSQKSASDTLAIYKFMEEEAPDYFFAATPWLIANRAGGGRDPAWEGEAWFKEDGSHLPVVDKIKNLPARPRRGVLEGSRVTGGVAPVSSRGRSEVAGGKGISGGNQVTDRSVPVSAQSASRSDGVRGRVPPANIKQASAASGARNDGRTGDVQGSDGKSGNEKSPERTTERTDGSPGGKSENNGGQSSEKPLPPGSSSSGAIRDPRDEGKYAIPSDGEKYRVVEARSLTGEENHGMLCLFVTVLDRNGKEKDGVKLGFGTTDGQNKFEGVSGSKAPGKAEFVLFRGAYEVWIAEDPNARVTNLSTVRADAEPGNTLFHWSYRVVFQEK